MPWRTAPLFDEIQRLSVHVFLSAGQAPFEVEDPVETAQRIMHSPPVCGFPRGVSPECISFVQQARVNQVSLHDVMGRRTKPASQLAPPTDQQTCSAYIAAHGAT